MIIQYDHIANAILELKRECYFSMSKSISTWILTSPPTFVFRREMSKLQLIGHAFGWKEAQEIATFEPVAKLNIICPQISKNSLVSLIFNRHDDFQLNKVKISIIIISSFVLTETIEKVNSNQRTKYILDFPFHNIFSRLWAIELITSVVFVLFFLFLKWKHFDVQSEFNLNWSKLEAKCFHSFAKFLFNFEIELQENCEENIWINWNGFALGDHCHLRSIPWTKKFKKM